VTDLVVTKPALPVKASIFDLSPHEQITFASQVATELKNVIVSQKLYQLFQGKEYVVVEGWTTLGMLLGILPVEEKVERLPNGSYVAYVKLVRAQDGQQVGGASSLCGVDEKRWGKAEEYARRSMAVTRATGKAFRLGYSWIMRLAGYEPTPFEEMPVVEVIDVPAETPAKRAPPPTEDQVRGKVYEGTAEQKLYLASLLTKNGIDLSKPEDQVLSRDLAAKIQGDDMGTLKATVESYVKEKKAK
jgi:hypothetical protein